MLVIATANVSHSIRNNIIKEPRIGLVFWEKNTLVYQPCLIYNKINALPVVKVFNANVEGEVCEHAEDKGGQETLGQVVEIDPIEDDHQSLNEYFLS